MPRFIETSNGCEIWEVVESYGSDFYVYGAMVGGDARVTPSLGMARELAERAT